MSARPMHFIEDDRGEIALVFADGHDPAALQPLPSDFWDRGGPEVVRFIDGAFVEDFAALDAALCAIVDAGAEAFAKRFITPGERQAATYLEKAREVRDWGTLTLVQAVALTPAQLTARFPYIAAEAAAVGETFAARADLILTTLREWTALNAAIEARRQALKAEIVAADTVAAKRALAAFDWETLA